MTAQRRIFVKQNVGLPFDKAPSKPVACIWRSGSIAVTECPSEDGTYAITHVPTGLKMPGVGSSLSKAQALGIATVVARLGPWGSLVTYDAVANLPAGAKAELRGALDALAEMFEVFP